MGGQFMNVGTKLIIAMVVLMIGGLAASIVGDYLVGNSVDESTITSYTRAIDAKIIQIWKTITDFIKDLIKF